MAKSRSKSRTSPDDLKRALDAGDVRPVYLVVGEEPFFRHRARAMLREAVVDREGGSLVVFGPEDALETILSELRGDSLFSARRLVEVVEADKLLKTAHEALGRYLERPSASGVLVIDAVKIDRRLRFVQSVKSAGMIVDCARLYDDRLVGWLASEARARGVKLQGPAAAALVEEIGNNLFALTSELEKLVTFAGPGAVIGTKEVAEVVGRAHTWDVWGLTGALVEGDVARALNAYEQLLLEGTSSYQMVGTLNWQLSQMWKARRLLDAGADDRALMSQLRMPWPKLGPMKQQASRFSEEDYARLSRMLLDVDVKLKSTQLDEKLLVERFLVEACTRTGGPRR